MSLNIEKDKKILILAPHTDDGELGAGGTIVKLLEQGNKVFYAAFSTAEQSVREGFPKDILKTEVRNATKVLGIKEANLLIFNYEVRKLNYHRQEILEDLIKLRTSIEPDVIFMPSANDIHQDHITIAQEGLRVFKNRTILGYELIWNNLSFNTQCFVKLKRHHIERKTEALKQYSSQAHREYMSQEFLFALAKARGVQIGYEYAESFELVRMIL
jgi:LmbE family N-acetylglucosaminyl deacetylase